MVLSIMIALGNGRSFACTCAPVLPHGDLTKDDLKEIILQATAYCGAPAGNHAMHQAERGVRK